MVMHYVWPFVVGGLICVIGQICFDVFKLTPAHTMSGLTVAGAVLGGLGLYEPLVKFAGAGATVPITSFGNSLVQGVLQEMKLHGGIGILTGIFEITSAGVAAAIVFSFFASLVFKPKG